MTTCEPCKVLTECLRFPLVFYNLNANKAYANGLISIPVECGGVTQNIEVPPNTINYILPFPVGFTGVYPPLVMGCPSGGFLVRLIPSGATQAQIDSVVEGMIYECAKAYAETVIGCTFFSVTVFFDMNCAVGEVITFTGTLPSWITLDTVNNRLVGAAGQFSASTQEEATSLAQESLNEFALAAITAGDLTCTPTAPPSVVLIPSDTTGWGVESAFGLFESAGTFYGLSQTNFYSSVDGVNWTDLGVHDIPGPLFTPRGKLTFGNALFVSAADSSGVFTSPDGLTWTNQVFVNSTSINQVIFAGGQFVGVGNGSTACTSPDGAVWTNQSTGMVTGAKAVAFGAGLYVAVGAGEKIFSSPDGVTWTSQHAGASTLESVCFADGQFIAVGSLGKVITSPDGITWTTQAMVGPGSTIQAVGGGNGLFVLSLGLGNVYTSPDGVTWTFLEQEPSFLQAAVISYFSVANVIDIGF